MLSGVNTPKVLYSFANLKITAPGGCVRIGKTHAVHGIIFLFIAPFHTKRPKTS